MPDPIKPTAADAASEKAFNKQRSAWSEIVRRHYRAARDTVELAQDSAKQACEQALDEAAKCVEPMGTSHDSCAGERYAKAIRALKEQPPC